MTTQPPQPSEGARRAAREPDVVGVAAPESDALGTATRESDVVGTATPGSDVVGTATPESDVVGTATPAPKPAKPRLLQDGRDMFWSLAPLVVACIVLAGLVGTCSFQLSGPKTGEVPAYDAAAALKSDAETLGFPIRNPALPDGWRANSGRREGLDGARTNPQTGQPERALISTVGYLTPTREFVSLTQSNADEAALVKSINPQSYPTGVVTVDGQNWVVYEGTGESAADQEPVWTTRLQSGDATTQLAITGAGSTDEFRTLAAATQTAQPLSSRPR